MRTFTFSALFLVIISVYLKAQDEEILFYEGFESGGRPSGWTEEIVQETAEYWRYRNGGHNPNDPNNTTPPGDIDNGRNPDRAYSGSYNAYFQKESTNYETTKLVTVPIDLEYAIKPELRFWHAQVPWTWGGQENYDILRVYYRTSEESPWVLLNEYLDPVGDWTQQVIPLPDHSETYYLAFEATTRWGHGVVVDEIEIVETGIVQRYVRSLDISSASDDFVVAGTENNELLKMHLKVFGNTGDLTLNSLSLSSVNTSDDDIAAGGVKLYRTSSATFSVGEPIGEATGFSGGTAVFENIGCILPTGDTYLWVSYDLAADASPGNVIDGMFETGSISIGDTLLPESVASPSGSRTILETVYYDNFDEERGWSLKDEFEIAVPQGGGENPGNPNPAFPYSGSRVLGTDLSGQGDNPYKYEPGLNDTSMHYHAVSPLLDLFFYKDLTLHFRQWLNIETWDGAYIEVSSDGGNTWQQLWRNSNFVLDNSWIQKSYDISGMADRQAGVFIRFGLGDTDNFNNYSGWNIDNFVISGEYITRDMAVTAWLGPFEDCGMSSQEAVTVRVDNLAAIPAEEPIPVAYSIDGGVTWIEEVITSSIPVGGGIDYVFSTTADFSESGLFQVMAKTMYAGDQEPDNDLTTDEILSVPVYMLPFEEGFEGEPAMFWREGGTNSSWSHGEPAGSVIDNAIEGRSAWATNLTGEYNPEESSWVEGPCFDLSGNLNPVFDMSAWWHTSDPADHAAVMVSIDGRNSWQLLGTEGDGDEYSWNWYNSPQGWSGESNGWKTVRSHMHVLAGEDDVCFRVVFNSAAGEKVHEGFAFDEIKIYNVPPDVGVTAIHHLEDGCAYTLPVEIEIVVMNHGLESLVAGTGIPVGFDINGENKFVETFFLQEDLEAGATVNYTFESPVDLSEEGGFELAAYTMLEEDVDFYNEGTTNDTTILDLILTPIPVVDLGKDIYTVLPDTVVLDAYAGIDGYDFLWHDGSTGAEFAVQGEGEFSVTVTDAIGCYAISSVEVVRLIADIGVSELVAPVSDCGQSEEEPVTVKIQNFGTDTLIAGDQFTVHLTIDHGDPVIETVVLADTLYPGSIMEYTFNEVFDFSVTGTYGLEVFTSLDNDNDNTNDLLIAEFQVFGFPEVNLGEDVVLNQWEYTVDAGVGFASYLWHDGGDGQTFTVNEPGTSNVSVSVTDENDCPAQDEVTVTLNIIDIAADSILSPVSSCGAPDEVNVSARFRNTGNISLEADNTVYFGYKVNGGTVITEEFIIDYPLEPGETFTCNFSQAVKVEEGNWYNFKVFSALTGDMDQGNDTLSSDVGVFVPPVLDLGPDITVQVPEHTVDAGEGFKTYLWHDGSDSQTYTADQMGINDLSLTVTDNNDCPATDTKRVMILLSDIGVSDIQIAGSGCQGEEGLLTAEITNFGNTNISSTANIQVAYSINGGSPVTESLNLGSTLGAGTSVYHEFDMPATFTLSGENSISAWTGYSSDPMNENDTSSLEIVIHEPPSVDIGDGSDELYTTTPITLDAGEGFISYFWQDGSTGQILQIDSPVSDYFHVTVTDANSCMASDTVYVNYPETDLSMMELLVPEPDCELSSEEKIGIKFKNIGELAVKKGEEIKLYYRVDQGSQIEEIVILDNEMVPGEILDHTFSVTADLSISGSYSIIAWLDYHNDGNSSNNSRSADIEVYGFPEIALAEGADTLFASLPVTLSPGSGYATYLWQDNSTGENFEAAEFGQYWVTVTDIKGCAGSDTVYVESPLSSSYLPAADDSNIIVYPNPVSDRLFITIDRGLVHDPVSIELVTIGGTVAFKKEISHVSRLEEEIEVNLLPKGMYVLRITTGNLSSIRTVLVY